MKMPDLTKFLPKQLEPDDKTDLAQFFPKLAEFDENAQSKKMKKPDLT